MWLSRYAASGLVVEVLSHLTTAAEPRCFVAAQALAKGDRSELAVEMMTEMGISEIVPWQAARSIVRWTPDRAARSLSKMAFHSTGGSQAVPTAAGTAGVGAGHHSTARSAGSKC